MHHVGKLKSANGLLMSICDLIFPTDAHTFGTHFIPVFESRAMPIRGIIFHGHQYQMQLTLDPHNTDQSRKDMDPKFTVFGCEEVPFQYV